ncbi:crotonase/enoyl-CoA hydratase family protein [Blastococcus sp. TML/M2B]|uniref:crotonase/enoyl-CoA hydratase family protein n=1 Tax=unclassified Blastococcus TaxID=2619396 RepID=UPI00190DD737|nr:MULTISPECIES: crotonase/enoyl-CoA hydratase family protein [unclassified Blastococcus]MBN1093042.1 crotonase/enoyl-CoA hydratase family protein [Blastococcus sp. TML/M2B]MBN1096841.1 crotonase/enoyl-CoA hydratase family protein [Blastococcus sp. TML/C7B]
MANEDASRVALDVTDGVATVRLDRPEKMNALDPAMFEAILATGRELMTRDDVGAVVLHGAGRAFCAGLDFGSFAAMADRGQADGERRAPEPREPLGAAGALAQQVVHVWSLVPAPVIAAVHGVAFGGGLQIALGADIRLVAPDTQLSLMEIQWGICPDMCGTQLLPELVGRDVAKELALTGRKISGTEAARIGMATREEADPLAAAQALAAEIAGHSRNATRAIKRLVDLAGRVPLAEGLAAEQTEIGKLIGSPEQAAVVRARLAKR